MHFRRGAYRVQTAVTRRTTSWRYRCKRFVICCLLSYFEEPWKKALWHRQCFSHGARTFTSDNQLADVGRIASCSVRLCTEHVLFRNCVISSKVALNCAVNTLWTFSTGSWITGRQRSEKQDLKLLIIEPTLSAWFSKTSNNSILYIAERPAAHVRIIFYFLRINLWLYVHGPSKVQAFCILHLERLFLCRTMLRMLYRSFHGVFPARLMYL